jgi:hypothetical protein
MDPKQIMYVGAAALVGIIVLFPRLPPQFKTLLKNPLVSIVILGAIVKNGNSSPMMSTLLALVFLAVSTTLFENFDWENPNIYPPCLDVTYADILASYGGNKQLMLQEMINNVPTSWSSAPESATFLIASRPNHAINDRCKMPSTIIPN